MTDTIQGAAGPTAARPGPSPLQSPADRTALTRRSVLLGTAAVAGIGVLAACSPSGGAGTETPAGGTEAPAGGTETPAGGSGASLVALADVPVGGAVAATTAAGDPIVVAQPEAGQVVAFSAICTHQGCTVAPEGAELICPCHGSVFEALTGAVVNGPAGEPLPSVSVRVDGDQVVEA